jgi:hypothetical protein
VWETFRHKVEAFPGQGDPNGYDSNAPDFGFNAKPDYVYGSGNGVPPSGEVPPFYSGWSPPSGFPPFNNLDETTQIGQASMYAGAANPVPNGQSSKVDEKERILFEAKVNEVYYKYVAQPRTDQPKLKPYPYSLFQSNTQPVNVIKNNSVNYLNGVTPTPPPPYIQLPASDPQAGTVGSIEIKASFRRLSPAEVKSQRYYTAVVRYYRGDAKGTVTGYVDSNEPEVNETWGLTSLHIIQKTPNVPTFVFATFGQIDNIVDAAGNDVELPDGCTIQQPVPSGPAGGPCPPVPPGPPAPAFLPPLTITPSANGNAQTVAVTGNGQPPVNTASHELYFDTLVGTIGNGDGSGNYTLPINVNRRLFPITRDIVAANQFAQAQIKAANPQAVWQYYRLINVQARPLDVQAIVPGSEEETTFYLANEVVETNPELQHFSGTIKNGEPTNFNADGTYFKNVRVVQNGNIAGYTMGGCMGCHGTQGQRQGGDFSVLLAKGRVFTPDSVDLDPHIEQVRRALARKYLERDEP